MTSETSESSNQANSKTSDRKPSFPEVIDSTILSAFTECPLKAYREFCLNLASPTPSIHLHAGACFAKAIELIRLRVWEESRTYEEALELTFPDFIKAWGDFETPEFGSGSAKSFENMWSAVEYYFEQWPILDDPIQPFIFADGRSGLEFSFAVPLDIEHPDTGQPIVFGGRADLLGYYNNLLCIIDEKTTGALGQSWAEQWKMRGQFMGYCWAAQQMGISVNTAMVRGISILKTKFGHMTAGPIIYPQHILARWEFNMLQKIKSFILYYTAARDFGESGEASIPMAFGDACNSYGGCKFKDLCWSSDPSIWYDDFGYRAWNPLGER